MHHTVTTSHLITQQHLKDRTIVEERGRKQWTKISINKVPNNRSNGNKENIQDIVIRTISTQLCTNKNTFG